MYYYTAYHLTIGSEIQLPDLPSIDACLPDVVIRRGIVNDEVIAATDGGDHFAGEVRGLAKALIEEGRSITIHPVDELDEGSIRTTLLGPFFSVLLRQRGLMVLHASCVVIDEGAVAFIGASGWGKSTMAQAFYAAGYGILSDDVTAVDFSSRRPMVIPGHPQIKLLPDSAHNLVDKPEDLPFLNALTTKRVNYAVDGFPDDRLPLRKVYLLDQGADHSIEPVDAQTAFGYLLEHTRATTSLRTIEYKRDHMQQCAILIRTLPVARLRRKMDFKEIPGLVGLVADDVRSLSSQEV